MKITKNKAIGPYMTFDTPKTLPLHSWFWYKEGYSPQIVDWAIEQEGKKPENLLDPFCGVGTSLLTAKAAGINSTGVDASELAAFITRAKTRDYDAKDIEQVKEFSARVFSESRGPAASWDFELFDVRTAFPKRNLNDILFLRERIETQDSKTRDLLLLALLSILPQVSLVVKDGGVLKISKRKSAMPIKNAFRRRVKKIVADLENNPVLAPEPEVYLGDARAMALPDECMDMIVTSPPYLNNIDYSKVYGLELSLLEMSKAAAQEVRMRSVRSFIRTGEPRLKTALPPEVGEIGEQIPVIGTYFSDMEGAIKEMFRVLRPMERSSMDHRTLGRSVGPGSGAYVVVSNSVIHETHVLVDEILAEIGERIGFSCEIVVGAERIADVLPQKLKTRESVVIMKKS
jgi:methylase of polypeptide subunit release factors